MTESANYASRVYTCETHLTDPGFATPIASSPSPAASPAPKLSEEEIKKIAEEWHAKQKAKKEADEAANDKDKAKGTDGDKDKDEAAKPKSPAKKPTTPAPAAPTPKPAHPQFALHRQIFAMRQTEHRKRRQAAQAKQVAPKLPITPRGLPSSPSGPSGL